MKILIAILMLTLTACESIPYLKVGIGYKTHGTELDYLPCESKIIGRAEAGFMFDGYTVGYNHDSQLMCGWPVNKLNEISTDQIFIDKTWTF